VEVASPATLPAGIADDADSDSDEEHPGETVVAHRLDGDDGPRDGPFALAKHRMLVLLLTRELSGSGLTKLLRALHNEDGGASCFSDAALLVLPRTARGLLEYGNALHARTSAEELVPESEERAAVFYRDPCTPVAHSLLNASTVGRLRPLEEQLHRDCLLSVWGWVCGGSLFFKGSRADKTQAYTHPGNLLRDPATSWDPTPIPHSSSRAHTPSSARRLGAHRGPGRAPAGGRQAAGPGRHLAAQQNAAGGRRVTLHRPAGVDPPPVGLVVGSHVAQHSVVAAG